MQPLVQRALGSLACLGFAAATHAATCSPKIFLETPQYPVGPEPQSIAAGDFNGDTLVDIATVDRGDGSVSVLLNAGEGTFGPPIDSDAGNGFYGLAAADLDDDGALDLVVGAHSGVSILLGEGDGTFAAPVFYPGGGSTVQSIQTASLDPGGTIDIILGSDPSGVVVLLGDGDGTFQPASTYPAGDSVHSIALGDFDGNDSPDIVASNSQSNTIALVLGLGDGSFAPPLFFIAGTSPRFLVAADFDGDADDDVAVTTGSYVSILKGNGVGSFGAALQYAVGRPNLGSLVSGNFDEDGVPDLAVLGDEGSFYGSSGVVAILRGDGTGRFTAGRTYLAPASLGGIVTADFNGDALPDIGVSDYYRSTVWILLASSTGRFEGAGVADVASGIRQFASGDFNEDLIEDIAAVNGSAVLIYLGNPAGGFDPAGTYAVGGGAVFVKVVQDDLHQNLLVSTGSGFPGLWLLRGLGNGTFFPFGDGRPTDPYNGQFVLANFDSDGREDMAMIHGCCGFGGIDILLGNFQGDFEPPVNIDLNSTPSSIVAADFNHDTFNDIAVSILDENRVLVLFGNGDGTFQTPASYPVGTGPVWLALGTIGNELSLVTADNGSQSLSVLRGNFDGTFNPAKQIGLGVSPNFVGLFDFNNDGWADLYTANGSDNSVYLLFGSSDGVFSSPETFDTAFDATYAEVVNLDSNLEQDLIVATPGSSNLTLLYNTHLGGAVQDHPPACVFSPAELVVDASGFGPITYQWLKDGQPLADGGPISGAQTRTLTISPVSESDAGSYTVELTDACTTALANGISLQVVGIPSPPVIEVIQAPAPGVPGIARALADPGVTDFAWHVEPGFIVDGEFTDTVTFVVTLPGTSNLGVTVYFGFGCSGESSSLPVAVDFYDVPPSNPFHDDIVTIAQNLITAGCSNGNYCPTSPVRRDQMAVLLLKAEHGPFFDPILCNGLFADVPCPGPFTDWIEQLAGEGITGGCGTDIYCPDQSVTRDQMAVLLLKTKEGPNYVPPPATGIFGDVPVGSFAADFIEDLYTRGITGGCSVSPLLYCPDSVVLRQQMATLLVKTFFP